MQPNLKGMTQLARALGEVVYWLVWLLFLPVILPAFGLQALIAPVMSLLI